MKPRLILILLAISTGALICWLTPRNLTPAARPAKDSSLSSQTESGARSRLGEAASPDSPSADVMSDAVASKETSPDFSERGDRTQSPMMARAASVPESGTSLTPAVVLENMRSVFHQYAQRFGGNPVGTNPEITAALNGRNSRQIVFLGAEDGLKINDHGELVDNWGTPFFFHQLSRTEMEIHSAGPDRTMWTADDLVIR